MSPTHPVIEEAAFAIYADERGFSLEKAREEWDRFLPEVRKDYVRTALAALQAFEPLLAEAYKAGVFASLVAATVGVRPPGEKPEDVYSRRIIHELTEQERKS